MKSAFSMQPSQASSHSLKIFFKSRTFNFFKSTVFRSIVLSAKDSWNYVKWETKNSYLNAKSKMPCHRGSKHTLILIRGDATCRVRIPKVPPIDTIPWYLDHLGVSPPNNFLTLQGCGEPKKVRKHCTIAPIQIYSMVCEKRALEFCG